MKALITIYNKFKTDKKLYNYAPIFFLLAIIIFYFPYWGGFFFKDITSINQVFYNITGLDIYVTGPIMILIFTTLIVTIYDNVLLKILFIILYFASAYLSSIAFIQFETISDFLIFLPQAIVLIALSTITVIFIEKKDELLKQNTTCPIFYNRNIILVLILILIIINIFGRLYIKLFI